MIFSTNGGRNEVYEVDFGNGHKVFTFVNVDRRGSPWPQAVTFEVACTGPSPHHLFHSTRNRFEYGARTNDAVGGNAVCSVLHHGRSANGVSSSAAAYDSPDLARA